MRAKIRWGSVVLLLSTGCICPVEKPEVHVENGKAVLTWASGGVARICVTDPGVDCPPGRDDRMPSGMRAYWFVSARGAACFPDGIRPPIEYGVARVDDCMFDESDANGGVRGGVPLESGKTYRLGLAGFGGSPAYETFVAP
jgi:hypothetical protein